MSSTSLTFPHISIYTKWSKTAQKQTEDNYLMETFL